MPWPSCNFYKGHCYFFSDFQKYFSTVMKAAKGRQRKIFVHVDRAFYFPLSKYGIEVRFRGSTRGEENQENKDHFICVFPLQLGKVILIHKCISRWFKKFTQLAVFIFCPISLSVFSLFFLQLIQIIVK